MLPATFSPPHLLVFSALLCLLSSSSSLPPLLSSSHLSLHSPPISALASLVSSCPALVTLPLSSVVYHPPSFLRVQPTVYYYYYVGEFAYCLADTSRYRHEFKSQQLWTEIKFVLDNFAAPLTQLFTVSSTSQSLHNYSTVTPRLLHSDSTFTSCLPHIYITFTPRLLHLLLSCLL